MSATSTIARGARQVAKAEHELTRKKIRFAPMLYMGLGFAAAWIPFVGAPLSHFFDRLKNGSDANYELNFRAKKMKTQLGTILGKSADRIDGDDLRRAAGMSTEVRRVVDEVEAKKAAENRSSLLINTGVGVAGLVGAGGAVKLAADATTGAKLLHGGVQMAKMTAGALAGGAVAGLFTKDEITAYELMEAADTDIKRAKREGLQTTAAISPEIIFMVRVAQNPELYAAVNAMAKKNFGAKLHKLRPEQLSAIMDEYPEIADATLNEAKAIVAGRMAVFDIGVARANIGGEAGTVARSDNRPAGGHVAREMQRRAANHNQPYAANDNPGGGFTGRLDAERAMAALRSNEVR